MTIPSTATDQEVTDFFNGADGDKDGFLTKEEIKAFYVANSQAISDADLDAAFTKADTDADGKITSAELRASIPAPPTEPASPAENKTEPATPAIPAENKTEPASPGENKTDPVPPTEHEIKHNSSATIFNKEVDEFFDKWDINKDDAISKDEVKAALQSVWPGTTDTEVDAIVSKLDSDENGSISKDEIKMKEVKEEPPVETPLWLWAVVVAGYVIVGLLVLCDKKCSKHASHDHEGEHDHKGHSDSFHKADNESQKPLNPSVQ